MKHEVDPDPGPDAGDEYLGFVCEKSDYSGPIACDGCDGDINPGNEMWGDKDPNGDVLCVVCMSVVMKFNARFGIPGPRP